jgi:hypothetical protein
LPAPRHACAPAANASTRPACSITAVFLAQPTRRALRRSLEHAGDAIGRVAARGRWYVGSARETSLHSSRADDACVAAYAFLAAVGAIGRAAGAAPLVLRHLVRWGQVLRGNVPDRLRPRRAAFLNVPSARSTARFMPIPRGFCMNRQV